MWEECWIMLDLSHHWTVRFREPPDPMRHSVTSPNPCRHARPGVATAWFDQPRVNWCLTCGLLRLYQGIISCIELSQKLAETTNRKIYH